MQPRRLALLIVGGLLVGVGGIWTLQGVGLVGGSVMTGQVVWAIIGPIVVIVGGYLLSRARRRPE